MMTLPSKYSAPGLSVSSLQLSKKSGYKNWLDSNFALSATGLRPVAERPA